MSQLAATQIPKPADEQAFERACEVLWRGLLKDPNVQRVGRRGQLQNGVDLVGRRDRDPTQSVGVQCKLKGDGKALTESEVEREVSLALTFDPPLREYVIATTAPDSAPLQALARRLTLEQHQAGRYIEIAVWGWNTLEERIAEDVDARRAFDPSFTPFGTLLVEQMTEVRSAQTQFAGATDDKLSQILSTMNTLVTRTTGGVQVDDGTQRNAVEAILDGQIDDIRELIGKGDAALAQSQFERLWSRVEATASGRILFRIKANIGACRLSLLDDTAAAELLISAYDLAPTEPKASINKALGLLLRGDMSEARAFGEAALAAGIENEALASYVIQASRFDETVTDPLAVIPEALVNTCPVRVAVVDFQRHRAADGWRDAARALSDDFPDDPHARRLFAEAELEDCLEDRLFVERRQLRPPLRVRAQAATETLKHLWDDALADPEPKRPEMAGLCANLLVGLHALEDLAGGVAVAETGTAAFPLDAELARYAAMVALDAGDADLVERLLPLLEQAPEGRLLAFRHYANGQVWSDVARLFADALAAAPTTEVAMIEVLGAIAVHKVAGGDLTETLEALIDGVTDDPRCAIVIAAAARDDGLNAIADAAYQKARNLLGSDGHIARRLMVAHYAVRAADWSVVADALDGWIDISVDSSELRTLARAYVNETPVRKRGTRFFKALPEALKVLPVYSQAAGLFHFNRGAMRAAEIDLRRASQGGQLLATLALLQTLKALGREREIAPMVRSLDCSELHGDPSEKMQFAQALRDAGDPEGAARFGYEVLLSAPNDAGAALGYFCLIIGDNAGTLIPNAGAVAVGVWIELASDDPSPVHFLIVEDDPRPSEGRVTVDHPLVKAALGLAVGGEFTVDTGIAGPKTWKVTSIKHRYLHAFHDICENYETRFPGAGGLWRITMPENDITPALDMIKRLGEADERTAELYLDRGLPLSMVAVHVAGSSVGFADFVRQLDRDIETALGIEHEREVAYALIANDRGLGLVLDAYAAWTVGTMDAFAVLKAVFGELIVSQSAVNELRQLRSRFEPRDGDNMTLGWAGGKFSGQLLTPEQAAEQLQLFDDIVDRITAACTVAPVEAPDNLTPIEELIAKTFGPHILDPAYLAADRILLSEDRHYRDAANQMLSVKSLWLQPILLWARSHRIITQEEYARFLVQLGAKRHSHLGVDTASFVTALKADETAALDEFRQLCRYLGGPTAEMISHLYVAIGVMDVIWSDADLPTLKILKATNLLLTALVRGSSRPWALVLALLMVELPGDPGLYVRQWAQGHFLSLDELETARRQLLASREGLYLRDAVRNHGASNGRSFRRL
jgi:tetratricopeptide (TPR) repeat protein